MKAQSDLGELDTKSASSEYDVDEILGERSVQHLLQLLSAGGRELRRLDNDSISGSEHVAERSDRQVVREIEGREISCDVEN